jgi:hypothetical protein
MLRKYHNSISVICLLAFLWHLGHSGGLLGQLALCDHYDGRFVALEFASMDFYSVLMQCHDSSDVFSEEVND